MSFSTAVALAHPPTTGPCITRRILSSCAKPTVVPSCATPQKNNGLFRPDLMWATATEQSKPLAAAKPEPVKCRHGFSAAFGASQRSTVFENAGIQGKAASRFRGAGHDLALDGDAGPCGCVPGRMSCIEHARLLRAAEDADAEHADARHAHAASPQLELPGAKCLRRICV